MSKIFFSHSSANNAQALALALWLQENGWDDYFLDIEPTRGLSPGERWLAALKQAAHRCEAVVCLISPAWRNSPHCLTEFLLAQQLGKVIFGVLIEDMPLESLPKEMTAEWQLCDLVQGVQRHHYQVFHDPIVPQTGVSFAEAGLTRLKVGLQRVGLDPASFPWPPPDEPKRTPYRGMKPLEAVDAAVFFGRDAAIVRGLDTLRAMQEQGIERMLVILGASGSGKSSFMRAGLWPRLKRDDVHFLPLPVIRPEHAVLSGDTGLIVSLEAAFSDLGLTKTRAIIRAELQNPLGLKQLLAELQHQAHSRIGAGFESSPESAVPVPTIVIAIDQGEELAVMEGRKEAELFLAMLAELLGLSGSGQETPLPAAKLPLVVVTIRSDAYERLQTEPSLEGNHPRLFDLPPISPKHYKTVIEGPAVRAMAAGRKLVIEPALTEQLLHDASGTDALPLLAFTLERLFADYGADGNLRLDEYRHMGGVRGSIEAAVTAAFANPERQPAIPVDETKCAALLKEAFVPWLASIDPHTSERKRRIARWAELPVDTHSLLKRLIEARLLLSDRRKRADESKETVTVEVAHEALLRQWDLVDRWLDEEANNLKTLEEVQRAASDWINNNRLDEWLIHGGERLVTAERIQVRTDFSRLLGTDGSMYLSACRGKENHLQRALEGTSEFKRMKRREDLARLTSKWNERKGLARLFGLIGWWNLYYFRGLASKDSREWIYMRWSFIRAIANMLTLMLMIVMLSVLGESVLWIKKYHLPAEYILMRPKWLLGYVPKPELLELQKGSFIMGCKVDRDAIDSNCSQDEMIANQETILQSFSIGKYEVTFLEYDAYVWYMRHEGRADVRYPSHSDWGRLNRPVINISWSDAKGYLNWLSKETGKACRLPSEVEWEFAARGGTEKKYGVPAPNGSDYIIGRGLANCKNCGSEWDGKKTAPVGSFPSNSFNLYDMAGNVQEWIEDVHQPLSEKLTRSIVLESEGRVVRGGSWADNVDSLRPSFRSINHPDYRSDRLGFRVLCESPIN